MADLFAKFQCTYCQEDVTGLRVKCVECNEFELCLQCFSLGAEIGSHKNDHAYQFVNSGAVGVTFGQNGWSAREELHLLDAVEFYGFGNWEDIGRHIESRSADDAKDQYTTRYLDGTIGKLTWPPALSLRPNLSDSNLDMGPLSPSSSGRLPPLELSAEEAKELAYTPLRDDFSSEFDNDAEAQLAPLCMDGLKDDDLDIAFTLVQVDLYVQTLRERARRKRMAKDYQLVSNFFGSNRRDKMRKKVPTKDEKEFQEGMKVFTQFHTAAEHEQFLQNMQREQELKLRLTELARYRTNGITRYEECMHFEQELLAQQPVGSSGENLKGPEYLSQISSFLRKGGRSEEADCFSIERKCILENLGILASLGKVGAVGGTVKLLSRQELALCSALSVSPNEYLAVKAAIIKVHIRLMGQNEADSGEIGIESGVERSVHMFLATQNWLPSP